MIQTQVPHRVPKSHGLKYHRIVTIEPPANRLAITPDAPTAEPQSFRTADRWFARHRTVNMAQTE